MLAAHLQLAGTEEDGAGRNPATPLTCVRPPGRATASSRRREATSPAHFRLVANAHEPELVELAAIQLEQVYAAYARTLPPRTTTTAQATTILLTGSLAEYQAVAKSRGLNLFNPAFYDPARNQIVCGSDLERLCDELEEVRGYPRQAAGEDERKQGRADEGLPRQAARGAARSDDRRREAHRGPGEEKRRDVRRRSPEAVHAAVPHEAFHAYLGTFVYPAREGSLPLWFNEGLAQIFETAIVEVGELRVGHADPVQLRAPASAGGKSAGGQVRGGTTRCSR